MDKIKELETKIASLNNHTDNSVWSVLDNRTKELSKEDIEAINSSNDVKTVKEQMLTVFVDMFLFSKFRDEFASIPSFRPICDKYISSVLSVKSDIYKKNVSLEEENKRLKEELAEARRALQ